MELKNKVVIITGASSGIGFNLTQLIAKEGCKIALLARRKNKLDELVHSLKNSGSEFLSIECDISNKSEVKNSIKKVTDYWGRIDAAILNAGVGYRSELTEMSIEEIEEIIKVNVLGMIYFFKELIPILTKQGGGIIAGVSSLADARGFPKSGVYCASKSAASKFLESMRIELKPKNIKVITVKPGFVATPMVESNEFKMLFLMKPENAARIILDGIKKEKTVIRFPFPLAVGSSLIRLMPNWLFDRLAKRQL